MKEKTQLSTEINLSQLSKLLKNALFSTNKQVVVLSDFDETLCNHYQFDSATNNHVPQLNPELISLIKLTDVFIATARLATDPITKFIHQNLISKSDRPIICENGGVLCTPINQGMLSTTLSSENERELLSSLTEMLKQQPISIPGQNLFISTGSSTVKLRMQDKNGKGTPQIHHQLAQVVEDFINLDTLNVVSSGSSVTIQPSHISKANAFQLLVEKEGLDLNDLFVIGLGDAPNDKSIFQIANLSIGVSKHTLDIANVLCPFGEQTSIQVLKTIAQVK